MSIPLFKWNLDVFANSAIIRIPDEHPTEAYLLLFTNDKLMTHIFAMEASFRDVKTTRKRIALCTPAVSDAARQTLERLGIQIRDIKQPYHENFNVVNQRWKDTLAKFAIFQVQGITKFVYMDVDYILLHNLDYLFDLPTNGVVHSMIDGVGCRAADFNLNAGLLVAQPNETLYNGLFNLLDSPQSSWQTRNGDQDLLNMYLQSQYVLLRDFRIDNED